MKPQSLLIQPVKNGYLVTFYSGRLACDNSYPVQELFVYKNISEIQDDLPMLLATLVIESK